MTGGSLQMRLYRRYRRDGVPTHRAADMSGIGRLEAEMTDKEDAKNPPGIECYLLTEGMARRLVGEMADTPLGAAMVASMTKGE